MKQCPAGDGIKDRGAGGIECRVEGKTEEDRQACFRGWPWGSPRLLALVLSVGQESGSSPKRKDALPAFSLPLLAGPLGLPALAHLFSWASGGFSRRRLGTSTSSCPFKTKGNNGFPLLLRVSYWFPELFLSTLRWTVLSASYFQVKPFKGTICFLLWTWLVRLQE